MENKKKVLFVCTANRYRSRTAYELFKDNPDLEVDSCGLESFYVRDTKKFYWDKAKEFTPELYEWADIVYVMEDYHMYLLEEKGINSSDSKLINLGIEDIYEYNNPELIDLLKSKIKI